MSMWAVGFEATAMGKTNKTRMHGILMLDG